MKNVVNKYDCPVKLWKKWTDRQRIAYNNIRFIGRMDIMSHPKAKISLEEWDTISHNFAVLTVYEI